MRLWVSASQRESALWRWFAPRLVGPEETLDSAGLLEEYSVGVLMICRRGAGSSPAPSSTNRFSPSPIPRLPWAAGLVTRDQSPHARPLSPRLRRAPGRSNAFGKFPPPRKHRAGERKRRLASSAKRKIEFFDSQFYGRAYFCLLQETSAKLPVLGGFSATSGRSTSRFGMFGTLGCSGRRGN